MPAELNEGLGMIRGGGLGALLALTIASTAQGAQVTVDDDREECPSAGFTSIAPAIAAAQAGDVVSVCDGTYIEGRGGPGTTALTIDKPLTLRGAGAGRTFIAPAGGPENRIALAGTTTPPLGDAAGNVISVVGTRATIEGVTVFGRNVHLEAGIAFVGSDGAVRSSEIVDLVQSAGPGREGVYGASQSGVGIVATGPDEAVLRNVDIVDSIVEGYNAAGVIVDAARPDGMPQPSSSRGIFAQMSGNRITGGGRLNEVAQDGVRILNGASAVLVENGIADNFYVPDRTRSAAVRYENSRTTSQTRFNLNSLQGNGRGLVNVAVTGTCPNTCRADALQNWWGSPFGPSTDGEANLGDPVNGTRDTAVDPATGQPFARTQFVDYRDFLTRPAPLTAPLSQYVDRPPTAALEAPADASPGQPVALTAAASDDVGVREVSFLRGGSVIGVDRQAPYEASFTPTPDQAGSSQSIVAVATDSRGQTATASRSLRVAGPAEDRPPTVRINAPASVRGGGSFDVTADAADDLGATSVAFFLGTRRVCVDTTAPYSCRIEPRGVDVGRRTLMAVATDAAGQTATAAAAVRVGKFRPRSVTTSARAKGKRITLSGRVSRPGGVTASDACRGRVSVTVKRGKTTVGSRNVRVSRSCRFSARMRVSRSGRYRITARFLGNDVLQARSARARTARVR